MQVILDRPDGLHILTSATLQQLVNSETLLKFAGGFVPLALSYIVDAGIDPAWTLVETLQYPGPETYPLLTALLALDAELNTISDNHVRSFSISTFLAYRSRLSQVTLDTLRLPPLNAGGRYTLGLTSNSFCWAVRLDLHPRLLVAGHVRIAISSPARLSLRLRAAEERLERQVVEEERLQIAVTVGSAELPVPLTGPEKARLIETIWTLAQTKEDL
jgi:hypothetical protein